jgi:formamidopyrimidine-DNA glycosylase
MPDLPEVERTRRLLAPAMTGARFTRVRLNRRDLRTPFSPDFADRLRGRTVRALERRGKYLVAELSSGDALLMHLGMSGSFHVEPTGTRRTTDAALERRHDHVVFQMSSGQTITFNDPRRFGLMQILDANDRTTTARGFAELGPEPLSPQFDAVWLAARSRGRRTSLKAALLDQRVVAGLGNIYASEALHAAHLSPLRPASTIATAAGRPRPAAKTLAAAVVSVLRRAVRARTTAIYGGSSRFRVYDREGAACPTRGCRGTIRRITQAGRSTFYCPVCQR